MPQRKKGEQRSAAAPLVDTNVLVRFLMADDPPKTASAKALLERAERGMEIVELVDEVLTETVWTLQSFYKVPRLEIAQHLGAILSFSGVRCSSRRVILQALQIYATRNADFVDCLLAARALHRGVFVYTFDESDFKKLGIDWKTP